MLTLSNIVLQIVPRRNESYVNLIVTGTIIIDHLHTGVPVRMAIRICGEDKPGDPRPDVDTLDDDLLLTFTWHSDALKEPYKEFVLPWAPGHYPFTETQIVTTSSLDEDAGLLMVGLSNTNKPILMPLRDEIYADVYFLGMNVSQRSPTVISTPGGV